MAIIRIVKVDRSDHCTSGLFNQNPCVKFVSSEEAGKEKSEASLAKISSADHRREEEEDGDQRKVVDEKIFRFDIEKNSRSIKKINSEILFISCIK